MRSSSAKPRAVQGELRRLTRDARQKLLSWFREDQGTLPLRKIQQRIKAEFGFSVGFSSLSAYYHDHHLEITAGGLAKAAVTTHTIIIRIEVQSESVPKVSAEITQDGKKAE